MNPFTKPDTKAKERAEARQVAAGKLTARQYAAAEKKEGEKDSRKKLEATGKKLASGKLSPDQYAAKAKMANGGKVKKC